MLRYCFSQSLFIFQQVSREIGGSIVSAVRLYPLVCLLLYLCAGCSHPSHTQLQVASPARGLTPPLPGVVAQSSPEYAQAISLFQAGDRLGALSRINTLLAQPGLTDAQRTFLLRQQAICEGKKPTDIASAPVRTASSASNRLGDCGPKALALVMKRLDVAATSEELSHLAGTDRYGTSLDGLKRAAEAKGLLAEGVQMDGPALKRLDRPAVAWTDGGHYLAVLKIQGEEATIQDPNSHQEEVIETDMLLRRSGGILLTLQRSHPGVAGTK